MPQELQWVQYLCWELLRLLYFVDVLEWEQDLVYPHLVHVLPLKVWSDHPEYP